MTNQLANNTSFGLHVEEDWDFKRADTQYFTHGLHLYPARMVPQIARRLIKRYATEKSHRVLDPFCGSGSVIVESILAEKKAYGTDINPLAILLAQVKTKPLNISTLEKEKDKLYQMLENDRRQQKYLPSEKECPNLLFWFKKDVAIEMAVISSAIKKIDDPALIDYRRFFELCFSMTAIKASNIDAEDNPYFIRSMKGRKFEEHKPDVKKIFRYQVADSITRMKQYVQVCKNYIEPEIYLKDSRNLKDVLDDNTIQVVVTSPPYGEEKRTMAYASFSKLSLYWLGHNPKDLRESNKSALGGKIPKNMPEPPSHTLQNALQEISIDQKAVKEVTAFFNDYLKVLKEIYRVLRLGGRACIVIGNRTVRKVPILNDDITIELSNTVGFKKEKVIYRNIPKKVLPRRDGRIDLINRESIIILIK